MLLWFTMNGDSLSDLETPGKKSTHFSVYVHEENLSMGEHHPNVVKSDTSETDGSHYNTQHGAIIQYLL